MQGLLLGILFLTGSDGYGGNTNPPVREKHWFLGGQIALSDMYGSDTGLFFNATHAWKRNFWNISEFPTVLSVGGSIGYASYDSEWPLKRIEHSDILMLAAAYYHLFFLNESSWDPYAITTLGIHIDNERIEYYATERNDVKQRDIDLTLNLGFGVRYFVSDRIALGGQLMFGPGTLRLGLDYRIQ